MRSAARFTVSFAASARASARARASRASDAKRSASRSANVVSRKSASPVDNSALAACVRVSAAEIAPVNSSRFAAISPGAELASVNSLSDASLRSRSSALRLPAVSRRFRQPPNSLATSWARLSRAVPSRRSSSSADRLVIIAMRAPSTVCRNISTSARALETSSSAASAFSASVTKRRPSIASSSWRATANPKLSNRLSARFRSASARLRARPASATARSASRRSARAFLSASA